VTTTFARHAMRTTVVGLTSVSLAVAGSIALGGVASADPEDDLDQVRSRMETVSDKVDDLYHEAEVANERYLQAEERLATATEERETAESAVETQTEKVTEMTTQMGGFAAAAYRDGIIDPTLQMVLSDDPNEALAESTMVDAYADQQSAALATIAGERAELAEKQANVEETAALMTDIEADMAKEKQAIDTSVDEAESLLASLKDEEREILAEIEAQRAAEEARRAEAAARAARDAERDAERAEAATTTQAPTTTTTTTTTNEAPAASQPAAPAPEATPEPPPAPPASGRGGAAVAFAMGQIGDYYAYGGTGPSAWDCSGLTGGAWRAAGVSIPRTSQAQFYGLPRVSMNALQPGDIIGYYGGLSHVGIYIGNGQIVHASRPGRPVGVAPLYSMPVMGAVRPG